MTYQLLLTNQASIMAIYDLTNLVANKVSLLLAHAEDIKRNRLITCCMVAGAHVLQDAPAGIPATREWTLTAQCIKFHVFYSKVV